MAAGDLNKANGDVLYAEDISALVDMKAKQFKQTSQLIYNTAYTGFNAKTGVELDDIKYDVFLTDTATTKTNMNHNSTDYYYYPSVKTNQAATDTLHNPNSVSNPTYAFDMNDSTSATKTLSISSGSGLALGTTFASKYVGIVYIKASVSIGGSGTSTSVELQTYNGSSWTLLSTLATGTSSASYTGAYFINSTIQGIRIVENCNASTTQNGNYSWSTITYGDSDTSCSLIFQTTSLPTVKDCIATWNSTIDSQNTLIVSISADGSNYEVLTDATYHKFTNTGTNLYVKFDITRVDTTAVDKINSYSIWYNCGVTP